jgi:hypothetical protein
MKKAIILLGNDMTLYGIDLSFNLKPTLIIKDRTESYQHCFKKNYEIVIKDTGH